MSAFSITSPPITGLTASTGPTASSAAELLKRGKIKETADKFESSFLSVMMQSMFEGVKTPEPFGGGQGEEMFKSLLTDAMAKEVTKSGGVGVSATVQREMLKMQGLQEVAQ
ncbi:chemotaxis protein chel [Caulobacter radicis]|uniref:rod-binding protein n=1 Tax=Caulobacter radicis TaxID=2172650 RepID=UPI000D56C53C|nr:rod-binding protein [Caulobacter radicis]PVM92348.1 chemotaxis protein chel [Caulobacter radicis]